MKNGARGLLALLTCAALLCGVAVAEDEALSAPVDEIAEEIEVALGEPDGAWREPGEAEGFAVEAAPQVAEDAFLWDTGLLLEDAADVPRAVSAGELAGGDIGENASWTLSDDGVLTISGQGEVTWSPWNYEEGLTVRQVVVCEGITALPSFCFYNKEALTSASLPTTLAEIGNATFYGCRGLERVSMPGVSAIGEYAFADCASLRSLELPETLKRVDEYAFAGCAALTSVELPSGLETIGGYAFSGTSLSALKLPGSVKTIGNRAFGSVPLTSLELANGVEAIGAGAFSYTRLSKVTLPASVTEVGEAAFGNCGLNVVTVEGAPKLMAQAFGQYGAAVELTFKGGVPAFDAAAFANGHYVVLYPSGDKAWAKAAGGQYGGEVTWIAAKADAVKDSKRAKTDKLKAEKSPNGSVYVMDSGSGTYTRVIYTGKGVAVEIYKAATDKLTWKKTLKQELPLWGGFYSGKSYNFLIFGQSNPKESDKCEVVRVVRYTKNWHRVDAASVYGSNTVQPFYFGSLGVVESGNMLYLHTAHLMYKSPDGLNHQANFDLDVYIPSMQVTVVKGEVDNFGSGYVSHSFDQYILRDGDDVVQLDLGDAYPRAVAMYRWKGAAGTTVKSGSMGEGLKVMDIAGAIGNNYTGVSLAGLEATKKYYITAGVSVSQKGSNPSGAQNIFVAAVSKSDFSKDGVTLHWLTKYKTSDKVSLSQPRLVRLDEDSLLLMWTQDGKKTRYVFLDGKGKAASSVRTLSGALTNGKPMLRDGRVSWVYSDGSSVSLAGIAAAGALEAPELKAFSNTSKGIKVEWGKVKGASGYYVYRRTSGNKWKKVATVKGASKTSWVDKKAKSGKKYHYAVKAYKGKSVSGYNDTGKPVPRLLAPKKLKASLEWDCITLSWKKVSGASGYKIYRKLGSGKWKKIATVSDARRLSYTDWNTKKGKKHSYRVKAFAGSVTSAYSTATKALKVKK